MTRHGLSDLVGGLQAQDFPGDVAAQLLARHNLGGIAERTGGALQLRTVLGRETRTVKPEPGGDVAPIGVAQRRRERCLAAEVVRCAFERGTFESEV